jgi:hypothetical protein
MDRRRFLRSSLVSAAALVAAPAWIKKAFGDTACPAPTGGNNDGDGIARRSASPEALELEPFSSAFRRAQRSGKALLVFVIPANDADKWERGAAFGEWLNYGTDAQLAPLAEVEVVAATVAAVRAFVPSVGKSEPYMMLVDTQRSPVTARALDAKLPAYEDRWGRGGGGKWEDIQKNEERIATKRTEALSAVLIDAIRVPDGRVAQAAAEARARLVKQRVPGSFWAHSGGCGTRVEGDDDPVMVACGMGHTPARSSRFLYMYAETPGQRRRHLEKSRKNETL